MRKIILFIPRALLTIIGLLFIILGGIGMALFVGGERLLSKVKDLK